MVNNLVWILPLVAIEQMVAGELSRAVYLGIVFVIDLVVAVKWGLLGILFGKPAHGPILMGMGHSGLEGDLATKAASLRLKTGSGTSENA